AIPVATPPPPPAPESAAQEEDQEKTPRSEGYVTGKEDQGDTDDELDKVARIAVQSSVSARARSDYSNLLYHDPRTVVQTGEGLPSWGWREVSLRWRGPVERGQRLRFFFVPPAVNFVLAFLRVGLLLALGLLVLAPRAGGWRFPRASAARAACILLLVLFWPTQAGAHTPPPQLLLL